MPQVADNLIFDESIMYNVRYVKPSASDEDVHRACRQAQLHEDIEAREKGYSSNARHLMSSVMNADRIYVLGEGGRVIQTGTHNSLLLETDGEYAGLWRNHMGRAPVERTVEEMLDAV
ncbi:ABC transporter [Apiospora arundinis]|uniref:ABC transporter n=1 Tax=Apiospora arundinis TaxID=335852 RepID=A0ABR2I967_9PEZI